MLRGCFATLDFARTVEAEPLGPGELLLDAVGTLRSGSLQFASWCTTLPAMMRAVVWLLALVACGSSAPAPTAPDPAAPSASATPAPAPPVVAPVEPHAAKRFDAWLASLNSADVATIRAFREAHVAPDAPGFAPPESAARFSDEIGGFGVVKVETTTPLQHTVLLVERASGRHARVVVEVEPAPPHRIVRIELRGIETPDELLPPRLAEAEALSALRSELDKLAAADQFSGALLVARDGKPLLVEARGMADREKQIANTVDTRYRIGSMNKMFTSVALLQLVQAGKVKLDAPIGTYLPRYPNQDVATKVTPHHLLTHSGGTGDIFGPDYVKNRLTLKTHADYVKLYGSRALGHEPGADFAYSNYGFILAGAIIEAVTKQTYYDALAKTLYAKAGMKATDSPPESRGLRGRVVPYSRESRKEPWKSAVDTLPWRGTAAGGGDTTVKDLLAFATALKSGKLLDAKHLELATTPRTPMGYGYGFSIDQFGDVRCYGHGGGAPGMNGQLHICDSGYTIAVLANLDPPAADRLARFIVHRLPAK